MAKTFKITFNEDLVVGSTLTFDIRNNNFTPSFAVSFSHEWVTLRNATFKVTNAIPDVDNTGVATAIQYLQAAQLDYPGIFSSITRTGNAVFLTTDYNYLDFEGGLAMMNPSLVANVDFELVVNTTTISITSVSFAEATTNPCQNVKVIVETNIDIENIITPVNASAIGSSTYEFDFLRGQNIVVLVEDANGFQDHTGGPTPSLLSPTDFNLQLNISPGGTTLVVENSVAVGLDFGYSLDNTTWQTSNTFSGLAAGNYTLYVRDQFGCAISKTFVVDEYGIQTPYFYISKANSIRFANRIDFGDAGNYKTDENTLSCEVDVLLPYHEVQLFQTADVITTQFKSNYENNTAKVIRANGDEVVVPVVKKSNYIGNKDSRDARKYDLGAGKTGIYFTSGNIYDYNTGFPTGETHYLNGGLPIWAKSGNYVKVGTEWFLIEDILFDESKNAEIIVISSNYSGVDVTLIAGTIYNIFDYEIFEFTIDMVDYIGETIKVAIQAEDDNFTTINLLSEDISVSVKHEDAFEINYWNDDNTDIFYATGIKHKIRVPYFKRKGDVDESSDVHKTDATSILLSSELYEVDEFVFEPVTKEIWRKLMIALSHKNVLIDGIGYVKNGGFDTEGPLEDTNLYVLTAKMIKTGNVYNSQASGTVDFATGNIQVPGLIDVGSGGFLKY
jgi:hypothetical protein